MLSPRRLAGTAGLLTIAGAIAAVGFAPLGASAADHLDAPAAKADHRVDITDIYAYRQAGGTTLILNVDGLMTPSDSMTAAFRHTALYELKIDTNLDAQADIAYRVRFGPPHATSDGVVQSIMVRRATGSAATRNEWSGAIVATGQTTPSGSSSARVSPVSG